MVKKTIAAIATPLGESSIGVIRVSGEQAIAVADRVFFAFSGKPLASLSGYAAAYGQIRNGCDILDDAVALVFKAPKSYTGEDVVELSVHGGRLILTKTLRLLFENGAVSAEPGEFTKRAFLNGKLDLTKAESVMGLISAQSEAQLRLSRAAHLGAVSRKIEKIEEDLRQAAASIAVFSDFPDEEIEGLDPVHFLEMLKLAETETGQMLATYDAGRIVREGLDTVIVGKPNVGKSTLMNFLSRAERSIVTDVAGTTRDVIEETVTLGDLVLRLADTAGIHETEDKVESVGVARATARMETADLVLAVLDGSAPLDQDDFALLSQLSPKNTVLVVNKSDLGHRLTDLPDGFRTVVISAKEGQGFDDLCAAVASVAGTAKLDPDSVVLLNERQRDCAVRAKQALREAVTAFSSGHTLDAVGICVDDALAALYELTGKRATNEVTDEIFRRFCVGK